MDRRHLVAPCAGVAEPRLTLATRVPRPEDVGELAAVMLEAYRGTIDADGDETLAMAVDEVEGYLAGRSGPPLLDHSRVATAREQIVAAALVSMFEGIPLIAYLFTDPAWKGRGLAAGLVAGVMRSLDATGHERVHLWVTRGNAPAERIYERLGFTDADAPGPP